LPLFRRRQAVFLARHGYSDRRNSAVSPSVVVDMRDQSRLSLFLCLVLALCVLALSARIARAPASPEAEPATVAKPGASRVQTGMASWYGRAWQGRRTASGVRFDARKLTAAHRSLPLNTKVRVTNLANGKSVEVTINDRGPYVHHRLIDVSAAAAKRLGMTKTGVTPVTVETLSAPSEGLEIASADPHR
jgi:rare lipoprotein A